MSGTEMQRAKEGAAEIMRQKQAAGTISDHVELCDFAETILTYSFFFHSRG